MSVFYAVDLSGVAEPDLVLAAVDDLQPTAAEQRDNVFRVFFANCDARDRALDLLRTRNHAAAAVDVDDEDWARRSQQDLKPVLVGRVLVAPQEPGTRNQAPVTIVIPPSTGFGTGHHASTRLCLAALQTIDLSGHRVLDVGTGSGVLAIASALLGADRAVGVDVDPDAIQAASENLALNSGAHDVEFHVADFRSTNLESADVVVANLTGALLARSADRLKALVRPQGALVMSGIMLDERDDVVRAFGTLPISWEQAEDGWVGLALKN